VGFYTKINRYNILAPNFVLMNSLEGSTKPSLIIYKYFYKEHYFLFD